MHGLIPILPAAVRIAIKLTLYCRVETGWKRYHFTKYVTMNLVKKEAKFICYERWTKRKKSESSMRIPRTLNIPDHCSDALPLSLRSSLFRFLLEGEA